MSDSKVAAGGQWQGDVLAQQASHSLDGHLAGGSAPPGRGPAAVGYAPQGGAVFDDSVPHTHGGAGVEMAGQYAGGARVVPARAVQNPHGGGSAHGGTGGQQAGGGPQPGLHAKSPHRVQVQPQKPAHRVCWSDEQGYPLTQVRHTPRAPAPACPPLTPPTARCDRVPAGCAGLAGQPRRPCHWAGRQLQLS